jgi:hypothetical protein
MGSGQGIFGKRSTNSLFRRLTISTLLFLACLLIYFVLQSREKQGELFVTRGQESTSIPWPAPSALFSAYLAPALAKLPPVYPYSVIPGGVRSVAELREAIARDPLVKAHYQGFNLGQARVIRLKKDREVYVSYRRGHAIFWTSKKLILRKGETAITDGTNLSRTRCGNRIAEKPSLPHSDPEPTPVALDTPLPTPPIFPILSPAPPPGGIVPFPPVFIPIYPGGGGGPPPKHKLPPPVHVPEPDALYLLFAALPLAWLFRKKSRH